MIHATSIAVLRYTGEERPPAGPEGLGLPALVNPSPMPSADMPALAITELRFELAEEGATTTEHRFQYMNLRPVIRAFGEGEETFSWVFEGRPVIPGSKHLLAVLRLPRGCADMNDLRPALEHVMETSARLPSSCPS